MKLFTLTIGILMLSLASCMTQRGAGVEITSIPGINSEQSKRPGDSILTQLVAAKYPAIRITSDIVDHGFVIRKGLYREAGMFLNIQVFSPANDDGLSAKPPLSENEITDFAYEPSRGAFYSEYQHGRFARSRVIPISSYAFAERVFYVGRPLGSSPDLTYLGKTGQTIKIRYSEYDGSRIRPESQVVVDYDLSVSNIIHYNQAAIEIIEASADSIRFKVLRGF